LRAKIRNSSADWRRSTRRVFFHAGAKDQDKRRICGFSPLYSLIHLLEGAKGNHLKYSQAFTPETGSAVTFTSLIFQ
jgi:hypothetical protein